MGKALLESKRTFKAMDDDIEKSSETLKKSIDAFFGTREQLEPSKDRPIMEGKLKSRRLEKSK